MSKSMYKNGLYNLALITVLLISATAAASDDGYALLIQSSPPDAGSVTPGLGIHKTAVGQTVALSAMPKNGYRFLYWLGDVSSTTGPNTSVSVDSPKLVVAVFAREDFDGELPGSGIPDGQYAPGGGSRGFSPIRSPGSVSPTSGVPDGFRFSFPNLPEVPGDGDIPVPGDGGATGQGDGDIPVPGDNEVPEPATLFLLGFGVAALRGRGHKR